MTGTLLGISCSQTFFFSILPLLDTDSEDRQEETQQGATAAAFCPHGTWPVASKLNRCPLTAPSLTQTAFVVRMGMDVMVIVGY